MIFLRVADCADGIITAAYLSRRFGPRLVLMLAYVHVILLESRCAALSLPAIS